MRRASPVLVAIARVGAAVFDDLLLLTVAAAPQPWDAAEVEAAVDALFADAGLEPDFVDGRVKTDWLESLRAEFLEGTRLT